MIWKAAATASMSLALAPSVLAQAGSVGGSGRFVIVHSPHVQRDTVLLDTATGKTWVLTQDSSRGGSTFWAPMAREDVTTEMSEWLANHPRTMAPTQ